MRHIGHVDGNTVSLAAETFSSLTPALPNRVDYNVSAGVLPAKKYRLSSIVSETGSRILVTYGQKQTCSTSSLPASDTNYKDCFPRWVVPQAGPEGFSWWHKYLATQVQLVDGTGGSPPVTYSYAYGGDNSANAPLWHHDYAPAQPASHQSWGEWRGYPASGVAVGDPAGVRTYSDTIWLRGMDGDQLAGGGTRSVAVANATWTLADHDGWAGYPFENRTYSQDGGIVLQRQDNLPWGMTTATGDGRSATLVHTADQINDSWLAASSSWAHHQLTTTFDSNGYPATVQDHMGAPTASHSSDACTSYTRVSNTTAWIMGLPADVSTTTGACGTSGATLLRREQTFYDQATLLTAAPIRGDPSKTQTLLSQSPDVWQTSQAAYDTYGRIATLTDPYDQTTTIAYEQPTGLTSRTTVTNSRGWHTTTDYLLDLGVPIDKTDPDGHLTTYSYDGLGRLTAVWLPTESKTAGAPASLTYSYLYGPAAPLQTTTSQLQQVDSGNPIYLTKYDLFDSLGRIRETQVDRPATIGRMITATRWDARGNQLAVSGPTWAPDTAGTGMVNPAPAELPSDTVTSYDGANRPAAVSLVSQGVAKWSTSYSYGGDRQTTTPPDGGPTTAVWNPRGQTTTLIQQPVAGTSETSSYSYNPVGDLTGLTDPAGNHTSYGYNLAGWRTSTDDPDTGHTTNSYNPAGDLTATTDARGQTITTDYDTLGRPKARWSGPSGTGVKLAAYSYDTLAKGELTSATRFDDGGNAYTQTITGYDTRARPTGISWNIPAAEGALAGTYTETFGYDKADHRTSVSYPAAGGLPAETVTTTYDTYAAAGLPVALRGATDYVHDAVYDQGTGLLNWIGYTTNDSIHRELNYDLATNRLAELSTSTATDTLADDSYTYTPTGDVASSKDNTDGQTQCYNYDGLHRLSYAWTTLTATGPCLTVPQAGAGYNTSGKYGYWNHYSYDTAGNRTTDDTYTAGAPVPYTTRTYTYPAPGTTHPHAVQTVTTTAGTSSSTESFGYNPAGDTATYTNATSVQTSYSYGPEGQYTGATTTGQTTSTLTDANGDELIRHDPASTTLYIGGEELVATGSTVTATRYYNFQGSTVAARTPTTLTWLCADPQNNITLAVDDTTRNPKHRYYTPFGANRAPPTGWPTSHGYLNHQTNPATGLLDDAARQYNPTLGLFLSPDPLINRAQPTTYNPYAYASHNPISASDPTGLQTQYDGGGGKGTGGTGFGSDAVDIPRGVGDPGKGNDGGKGNNGGKGNGKGNNGGKGISRLLDDIQRSLDNEKTDDQAGREARAEEAADRAADSAEREALHDVSRNNNNPDRVDEPAPATKGGKPQGRPVGPNGKATGRPAGPNGKVKVLPPDPGAKGSPDILGVPKVGRAPAPQSGGDVATDAGEVPGEVSEPEAAGTLENEEVTDTIDAINNMGKIATTTIEPNPIKFENEDSDGSIGGIVLICALCVRGIVQVVRGG